MSEYKSAGKTTLTPDVLLTIARMAALEVDGVSNMAPLPGGINKLFRKHNDGVQVEVEDGIVFIDMYIVLLADHNVRETGRAVQQHVSRAITEITGLEIGLINVHIADIKYS